MGVTEVERCEERLVVAEQACRRADAERAAAQVALAGAVAAECGSEEFAAEAVALAQGSARARRTVR